MTISTTYTITSINSLKALTPSQRTEGYARLVKAVPAWYIFDSNADTAADNNQILMPDDNPATGRWIRIGGTGGGTSPLQVITSNYTASNGDRLLINSTATDSENFSDAPTITLPASPDIGSEIEIISLGRLAKIDLNGANFQGGEVGNDLLYVGIRIASLFKGARLVFGVDFYGVPTWETDVTNNNQFYF
ncbi:hypothetical protein [Anabaena sp. CCY 9910]|uniref:hypothetical protein n=1 Tax=Anabaena sp. CCY 9910 TaxID=3103870 RepID=UPI0039E039A5